MKRFRRRRRVERIIGALSCLIVVASSLAFEVGRAHAQTAKTVTITPNSQLTDGQFVDVQLSGFPGSRQGDTHDVRVRLCPSNAAAVEDCALDPIDPQDPAHNQLVRTDSNGAGSTPFVVKAQDIDDISGTKKFHCDAESPCRIYAYEGASLSNGAFAPISYALSTLACPETEPRIAGSGASAIRADIVEWQAETCRPPRLLNVSFATSNSVNGKMAFSKGLTDADFAISGMGLTDAEQQDLTARGVQAAYVPIALTSLVLVYNLWIYNPQGQLEQVTDLQLSPEAVAGIMEGRIANWADKVVVDDNLEKHPGGLPSKRIFAVGRADNSAATWWLTSWLFDRAKAAWEAGGEGFQNGPTAIFPAGNGVTLKTGASALAKQIRSPADIPAVGYIGFAYLSDAFKLGLPVVALKNNAGKYVMPTDASINAAVTAGTISSEGVFKPNFQSMDANVYPLPVVNYAIVPSAASKTPPLDPAHELVLSNFLNYVVKDGQTGAASRGYVPLPDALLTRSDASIAQIYKPLATPAPTLAPVPTAVASRQTTTTAPSTIERALNAVVPGLGSVVNSVLGPSKPAVAPPQVNAAPAATPDRTVNGVVKLASGGKTPLTAANVLWFGAIAVIVGRALAVLSDRRRSRARRTLGERRATVGHR